MKEQNNLFERLVGAISLLDSRGRIIPTGCPRMNKHISTTYKKGRMDLQDCRELATTIIEDPVEFRAAFNINTIFAAANSIKHSVEIKEMKDSTLLKNDLVNAIRFLTHNQILHEVLPIFPDYKRYTDEVVGPLVLEILSLKDSARKETFIKDIFDAYNSLKGSLEEESICSDNNEEEESVYSYDEVIKAIRIMNYKGKFIIPGAEHLLVYNQLGVLTNKSCNAIAEYVMENSNDEILKRLIDTATGVLEENKSNKVESSYPKKERKFKSTEVKTISPDEMFNKRVADAIFRLSSIDALNLGGFSGVVDFRTNPDCSLTFETCQDIASKLHMNDGLEVIDASFRVPKYREVLTEKLTNILEVQLFPTIENYIRGNYHPDSNTFYKRFQSVFDIFVRFNNTEDNIFYSIAEKLVRDAHPIIKDFIPEWNEEEQYCLIINPEDEVKETPKPSSSTLSVLREVFQSSIDKEIKKDFVSIGNTTKNMSEMIDKKNSHSLQFPKVWGGTIKEQLRNTLDVLGSTNKIEVYLTWSGAGKLNTVNPPFLVDEILSDDLKISTVFRYITNLDMVMPGSILFKTPSFIVCKPLTDNLVDTEKDKVYKMFNVLSYPEKFKF